VIEDLLRSEQPKVTEQSPDNQAQRRKAQ